MLCNELEGVEREDDVRRGMEILVHVSHLSLSL